MLADEYHKETLEQHYKPKDLHNNVPPKESPHLEDNFDYTGVASNGGVSHINHSSGADPGTVEHKYSQSPLIMGTLFPINTPHMDETVEYAKHSRELWVHEGIHNCLIEDKHQSLTHSSN